MELDRSPEAQVLIYILAAVGAVLYRKWVWLDLYCVAPGLANREMKGQCDLLSRH